MQSFNLRHDLSFPKLCGESTAAEITITNDPKKRKQKSLIAEYMPENIFKVDEIGLSFKVLPEKRLAFISDAYIGGKRVKRS